MKIVAKMFVSKVTRQAYNPDHAVVEMSAVSRGEENKSWSAATPSSNLTMSVTNPDAAVYLASKIGKEAHVWFDFGPEDES